tara:strand:+ start:72 stop:653 length:582 start_codon:yes stop_codon:yes gene_type:complete
MDYKKKYLKYKKKYLELKSQNGRGSQLLKINQKESVDIFEKKGYSRTYGELTEIGLDKILKSIQGKLPDTFIDLGSGKGNVLTYASKYFKNVEGVELDKERHLEAVENTKKYNNIKVTEGDLLEYPIKKNSVIYISSLCFNDDFLKKISNKLKNIPKDSYVFSSRRIPDLNQYTEIEVKQTWKNDSGLYGYRI